MISLPEIPFNHHIYTPYGSGQPYTYTLHVWYTHGIFSVRISASFFDFGKPSFHVTARFGHFENLSLTSYTLSCPAQPMPSNVRACNKSNVSGMAPKQKLSMQHLYVRKPTGPTPI
jgi:hypothetical protein